MSTLIGAGSPADATVLAVYFGGLTLGGVLYASQRLGASRWPLRTYALLEGAVALWALCLYLSFGQLVALFSPLLSAGVDHPGRLVLLRFLVAALWILPATAPMGRPFRRSSTVWRLIHAYMDSLRFGTRSTLRETESPYDRFLAKNNLPTEPMKGETRSEYGQRLLAMIRDRKSFAWVSEATDGPFRLHRQEYRFGPAELDGLGVFFTKGDSGFEAHAGNCVACHTPPRFTDQSLHNNGVSQAEYDSIFGSGAFAALDVPDLATRNARFDEYLPASRAHPHASGRFRSAPDPKRPGYTDLGVWNVFANPEMPKPQAALRQILCGPSGSARIAKIEVRSTAVTQSFRPGVGIIKS